MKRMNAFTGALVLSAAAAFLWLSACAPLDFSENGPSGKKGNAVLAKVAVTGMIEDLNIPVHAHLQGKDKGEYVLTFLPVKKLVKTGHSFKIIDNRGRCSSGRRYLLAMERFSGLVEKVASMHRILNNDGRQILICADDDEAMRLAEMGFSICWLSMEPMILNRP